MESHLLSGSISGPFEKAKSSVYYMAMGMIEYSFIYKMIEEDKIDALCKYLLTDPRLYDNLGRPN